MKNILTVDVEDWRQSTLDQTSPISDRPVHNTTRLLGLLAQAGARATFFVQGMVAEKYPELVRTILREGHEIGTHGYGHVPIFHLTPSEFEADLKRSLSILHEIVSEPVLAYRAPDFSIRTDTMWATRILTQNGIRFDSSVFPFAGRRYGIPGSPLEPYEIAPGLTEVPLCVVSMFGRRWPAAGGGYLRLVPYWLTSLAIRRVNSQDRAAVVYIHPYELDADDIRQFKGRIPARLYYTQGLFRGKTEGKLRRLFNEFEFVPLQEAIGN